MEGWTFEKLDPFNIYTLPAGTYYIGDICYVLDDVVYESVFGETGYEEGLYMKDSKKFFLVGQTSWGDGEFSGSDGCKYLVDAGVIGIVSEELISSDPDSGKDTDGGKVYTFLTPVVVTMEKGIFTFESKDIYLRINTGYEHEDEDDEGDDEEHED